MVVIEPAKASHLVCIVVEEQDFGLLELPWLGLILKLLDGALFLIYLGLSRTDKKTVLGCKFWISPIGFKHLPEEQSSKLVQLGGADSQDHEEGLDLGDSKIKDRVNITYLKDCGEIILW